MTILLYKYSKETVLLFDTVGTVDKHPMHCYIEMYHRFDLRFHASSREFIFIIMQGRKEILGYIEMFNVALLSVALALFPLVFSSSTTDPFALPKQILLAATVVISIVLFGVRMIIEGKVRFRTTPFDLPVLLFTIAVFLSALFSVNRNDAFIAFAPVLFAILLYFIMVNVVRDQRSILFVAAALVIGGVLSSLLSTLSFFKIYLLPFTYVQAQTFSTFGSLLDQALYLALVLPVAGYIAYPLMMKQSSHQKSEADLLEGVTSKANAQGIAAGFSIAFIIMLVGLAMTIYMLLTLAKPPILPFETGFQTAFAVISQNPGRVLLSFLFGNGYGTFLNVFSQFKQASYNANDTLWTFSFFRSSSFVLELLATTGFAGLLSFLFIIFRAIRERYFFLPLLLAIIAAFILPFSFTLQALFFVLLGVFACIRGIQSPRRFADLEFYFVALKQGLLSTTEPGGNYSKYGKLLPIVFFLVISFLAGALSYFAGRFIISDVIFQKSLVAASKNDGKTTYELQQDAIKMFPTRDAYYRIFSQTNLALANSLAQSQPKGSSPSAETQNNILTLIQQSITAGRVAVTIAPQTALNWNNLSSIYRSLIGFGQNAEQFAVVTNQQAIQLDPANPQQYITLGGIYYQLGRWDDAQRQFQLALQLKNNYANAWYNLGHALEAKGDLQTALAAYGNVKTLVAASPDNVKLIAAEIDALQKKIEEGKNAQQQVAGASTSPEQNAQTPANLEVNKPETQLPERNPKATIEGPKVTITPTAKKSSGANPSPSESAPSVSPTTTP